MEFLRRQGEFEIIDIAERTRCSCQWKPKRGAKIRAAVGGTAGGAKKEDSESNRAHVSHTITTAGGATVAASAAFIESRAITMDFVRRSLVDEPGG